MTRINNTAEIKNYSLFSLILPEPAQTAVNGSVVDL